MRRLSTVTRWVITGRNVEQLTKAYEGCGDNALALQLDVSNEEQAAAAVNAAVAYFGRIPASASSVAQGRKQVSAGSLDDTYKPGRRLQFPSVCLSVGRCWRLLLRSLSCVCALS